MALYDKKRMVATIFKVTLVIIVLVLILLWFLGGGVGKVIKATQSFHFLSFSDLLVGSTTFSNFQLPWQPAVPAIEISPVGMPGEEGEPASGAYSSSAGSASTYAGAVSIVEGAARTQAASGQYIELRAEPGSGSPINISGWSLESALSGLRAYIPQASTQFLQNRINPVVDVLLQRGGTAIVLTGASPVGVSFRENKCTGYLGTLQPYVPPIRQECPSPLASIPRTQESEAQLGSNCFDYLASLPACTFPSSPPPSLSSACQSTIQNELSYNGCVKQYGNTTSFMQNSWRLFLAHGAPLWDGEHDVIRLLDREGRVVTILNY